MIKYVLKSNYLKDEFRRFKIKNFLKDNGKAYNRVLNLIKPNSMAQQWLKDNSNSTIRIYKVRNRVYELYAFKSQTDFNPQPFLIKEDNYYI